MGRAGRGRRIFLSPWVKGTIFIGFSGAVSPGRGDEGIPRSSFLGWAGPACTEGKNGRGRGMMISLRLATLPWRPSISAFLPALAFVFPCGFICIQIVEGVSHRNLYFFAVTPSRGPMIDGVVDYRRLGVRKGDELRLNCSCHRSSPPTSLSWFINNHKVQLKPLLINYT